MSNKWGTGASSYCLVRTDCRIIMIFVSQLTYVASLRSALVKILLMWRLVNATNQSLYPREQVCSILSSRALKQAWRGLAACQGYTAYSNWQIPGQFHYSKAHSLTTRDPFILRHKTASLNSFPKKNHVAQERLSD